MRTRASVFVISLAGILLATSLLCARAQSRNPALIAATSGASERLTEKLYPRWKLANLPNLNKAVALKKGSRVCKADVPLMISAIVGGDPHFLFQDKDCEVVDVEIEVQVIDRCAGEQATCNALYRFQEKFSVVFVTWEGAPRTITMDLRQMRPLLGVGMPTLWVSKSSLQN